MLYSNINNQIRVHSHGGVGIHAITHSAAQDTVQAVQQAMQMQQMYESMQPLMYPDMQPHYSSTEYYNPIVISGEEILYFSTIPYGAVYNL